MSTRNNPGPFNCYAAALPDEPVFTVLARDPAFPATLAFWKEQRVSLGKDQSDDDIQRLLAIPNEIAKGVAWRAKNLDPVGDGIPSWRLPRGAVDDEPPVRMILTDEMRSEDRGLMVSVGKAVREIANELQHWWREDDSPRPGKDMESYIARLHEQVERLSDAIHGISNPDTALFSASSVSNPDDPEDDDFAIVEERGRGPICSVKEGMVLGGTREAALGQASRIARLLNAAMAGETPVPMVEVYTAGRVMIDGEAMPVEQIEAIVKSWKQRPTPSIPHPPTVDTKPDDLAHNPEVPGHRFATFVKGERYAYARGLEINPIHLPTALDAMAKDGWELLAIFGATDSQHVGFIFQKRMDPVYIGYIPPADDLDWEGKLKDAMERAPKFVSPRRADPEYHPFAQDRHVARWPRVTEPSPMIKAYQEGLPLHEIADLAKHDKVRINLGIHGSTSQVRKDIAKRLERLLIGYDGTEDFRMTIYPETGRPAVVFDHEGDPLTLEHKITSMQTLWPCQPPKKGCADWEYGRGQEP